MVHAYSLIHDDLPPMDDDDLRRGRPTCHKVFGEAMAILAGDSLLALAFEVLARDVRPPELAAACCADLARAAGPTELVGGQADDLAAASREPDIGLLEAIHRRKTGAMFRVCLRLGGRVAGAENARMAALDEFGRSFGLAFQITDDLLDVAGREEVVGKRVGKDARLGKMTFPGLIGVEASRQRAQELVAQAKRALAPLGEAARPLVDLAEFILARNQ
jgi:geranylgeranyl diphosphate synthase type II